MMISSVPRLVKQERGNQIALLCQHFYPEMIGTGMNMTELATGLVKKGWAVTVYCAQPSLGINFDNSKVPSFLEYKGVKIRRVQTIGSHGRNILARLLFAISYTSLTAWAVFRNYRDYSGLIVTTNPPFVGLVALFIGFIFNKPYIFIVHDVYPDTAVRLGVIRSRSIPTHIWEYITRSIMRGADAVVVIGRDMQKVVKKKCGEVSSHRILLIHNWSDEQNVYPVPQEMNTFLKNSIPKGQFVVQYSGRMGATHNLEPLIEAAALLVNEPVLFQFIGDGFKRAKLYELVQKKCLVNVQFLPYQPTSNLAEVLSAADLAVVCLESSHTGLSVPSKTYGIMASGTPILGLLDPKSEIGLTITENNCGVVICDPNGNEIAAIIRYLIQNPDRLREMGTNAYQAFKRNYTMARSLC
jgi:glycosyltransferase involved in cell wall biosynthesis